MTKIYFVKASFNNLKILEAELIKITPEQIRIDNKSVKVVWSGDNKSYTPYLSSRLQRHQHVYFDTLPLAIEGAIRAAQEDAERIRHNLASANKRIIDLIIFATEQKEAPDAS